MCLFIGPDHFIFTEHTGLCLGIAEMRSKTHHQSNKRKTSSVFVYLLLDTYSGKVCTFCVVGIK